MVCMTNLSIVLPTYNEAKRVRAGIDFAKGLAGLWDKPTEIMLVDDGSTDDTVAIAAAHHTELSILSGPHQGKGAAVRGECLPQKGASVCSRISIGVSVLKKPTECYNPCTLQM